MEHSFTEEEINFLRKNGLFTFIAKRIKSPRARIENAVLSSHYVRNVLIGRVTCNNNTTAKIKQLASVLLRTMQSVDLTPENDTSNFLVGEPKEVTTK